ncbi:transposase [Saccharopolyspora shandongensis]|uniref:transposase n=1 Tax=Saccharopolyspora shandongensis TaxID=418495 RepID=UPI00343BD1A1
MIRRLAEQLGAHPEALRNWIRQDEADRGQRDDRPTTSEAEEPRRLRKENAELKRVNEILKEASVPWTRNKLSRRPTRPPTSAPTEDQQVEVSGRATDRRTLTGCSRPGVELRGFFAGVPHRIRIDLLWSY